jgi:hypothetical protein
VARSRKCEQSAASTSRPVHLEINLNGLAYPTPKSFTSEKRLVPSQPRRWLGGVVVSEWMNLLVSERPVPALRLVGGE